MDQKDRDEIMYRRALEALNEDYVPVYNPSRWPSDEARVAMAAEYMAYHVGQISKNLARIADRLDAID